MDRRQRLRPRSCCYSTGRGHHQKDGGVASAVAVGVVLAAGNGGADAVVVAAAAAAVEPDDRRLLRCGNSSGMVLARITRRNRSQPSLGDLRHFGRRRAYSHTYTSGTSEFSLGDRDPTANPFLMESIL